MLIAQPRGSEKPSWLRRSGIVPMGLIVHGRPTMLIQAKETDVRTALARAGGVGMMKLKIEGESKPRNVVVKSVDRRPLNHEVVTVAFMEVSASEVIHADIPIHGVGVCPDVEHGRGTIVHPADHVKVSGKVSDLPTHFDVDLSKLEVGSKVHVSDLSIPKGITVHSAGDTVLFSVQPLRAAHEEAEAVETEAPAGSPEPEAGAPEE